jgi:hypothetical protein
MKRRLSSSKIRYISLGGRVVLINSILGEIPIFYVSLFKLTTMVWKLLLRIQRVGLKGRGGLIG